LYAHSAGLLDTIRVFCFAQSENNPPPSLYSNVILIYLLTTRRVPGYPLSYPVGYPDNELPDNGSPKAVDTSRAANGQWYKYSMSYLFWLYCCFCDKMLVIVL